MLNSGLVPNLTHPNACSSSKIREERQEAARKCRRDVWQLTELCQLPHEVIQVQDPRPLVTETVGVDC